MGGFGRAPRLSPFVSGVFRTVSVWRDVLSKFVRLRGPSSWARVLMALSAWGKNRGVVFATQSSEIGAPIGAAKVLVFRCLHVQLIRSLRAIAASIICVMTEPGMPANVCVF